MYVCFDRCDNLRGGCICVFIKKERSYKVVKPP